MKEFYNMHKENKKLLILIENRVTVGYFSEHYFIVYPALLLVKHTLYFSERNHYACI